MQNLNLCKTHRFTELLVIRSPMPIYIRKKNVEIFKLYQNCRNDVQFNSSLRKKEKKKVIFFFFFVFRFTNKQIQKIEKRKSISAFPFSFYLQKYTKKRKTKTYFCFPFFVLFKKYQKSEKQKLTSVFRFIYSPNKFLFVILGNGLWGGGGGGGGGGGRVAWAKSQGMVRGHRPL